MSRFTDPKHLRSSQYQQDNNLNARIQIHARFSTSMVNWFDWVFALFDFAPDARILELGCGNGKLWQHNQARIPAAWHLTLTDLSAGMVRQAQAAFADIPVTAHFDIVDAQALPFPDAHFDAVIANHMLYHVPDIPQAIGEARRVLKSGGRFLTATVGKRHMAEYRDLRAQFFDRFDEVHLRNNYDFDQAQTYLRQVFPNVTLHPFDDHLRVTDSQALVDYALSWLDREPATPAQIDAFRAHVESIIARDGAFHIQKEQGVLVAR